MKFLKSISLIIFLLFLSVSGSAQIRKVSIPTEYDNVRFYVYAESEAVNAKSQSFGFGKEEQIILSSLKTRTPEDLDQFMFKNETFELWRRKAAPIGVPLIYIENLIDDISIRPVHKMIFTKDGTEHALIQAGLYYKNVFQYKLSFALIKVSGAWKRMIASKEANMSYIVFNLKSETIISLFSNTPSNNSGDLSDALDYSIDPKSDNIVVDRLVQRLAKNREEQKNLYAEIGKSRWWKAFVPD